MEVVLVVIGQTSNFFKFDQVSTKVHENLPHQISLIKSTTNMSIMHFFGVVDANIILYKLSQKFQKFDLGQTKMTYFFRSVI